MLRSAWSLPTALAFLAWYVFAPQCISTLAVTRRETNSWRWPIFMFTYLFGMAYVGAGLTYWISRALLGCGDRRGFMAGSVKKVILIGKLGDDSQGRTMGHGGKG